MTAVSGGYYGRNTGDKRNRKELFKFDIGKSYEIGKQVFGSSGDKE